MTHHKKLRVLWPEHKSRDLDLSCQKMSKTKPQQQTEKQDLSFPGEFNTPILALSMLKPLNPLLLVLRRKLREIREMATTVSSLNRGESESFLSTTSKLTPMVTEITAMK